VVIKSGRHVSIQRRPHDRRRHSATFVSDSGAPIEIVRKATLRHANQQFGFIGKFWAQDLV
jgi:hypothetical protein